MLLDGAPIYSCNYLAVWTDGRAIETVDGLADETGAALARLFANRSAREVSESLEGVAKFVVAGFSRP